MNEQPRLSRMFRLQWEEAQDAYVLLYPEGMVKLNTSAAEIIKLCDGRRALGEIVALLEQAFNTSGLAPSVKDFVVTAQQRGWLV